MRSLSIKALTAVATLALLGGCTHSRSAQDLAMDYNIAFARSRDEMILQNILRASAREPLQFSTMSGLTGEFGTTGGLQIPFTNVIAGGKDSISPTLSLEKSVSPNITITPLASREFTNGILKPISPETINLLRGQGFDLEFLLPLVVGGVVCPGSGKLVMNTGNYAEARGDGTTPTYELFREMFRVSAPGFSLKEAKTTKPVTGRFAMPSEEAMRVLKEGVGGDYAVRAVMPGAGGGALVELDTQSTAWNVDNMQYDVVCGPLASQETRVVSKGAIVQNRTFVATKSEEPKTPATPESPKQPATQGAVMLRSVEAIIYFLGESHRYRFNRAADPARASTGLTYYSDNGGIRTLFKIDWGLSRQPKAVSTRFHDYDFFVPRLDIRNAPLKTPAYDNRTMKTLSLLNELIALQTSEATIEAARPLISIGN